MDYLFSFFVLAKSELQNKNTSTSKRSSEVSSEKISLEKNVIKDEIPNFKMTTKNLHENIYLVNNDYKEISYILNKILNTFSYDKNIFNTYNNNIYIITDKKKKYYKKILLENPYLYFLNFIFVNEIPENILDNKKTLIVIDKECNVNLENKSYHYIFINFPELYTLNKKTSILFHKKTLSKSNETDFYNKFMYNFFISFKEYKSSVQDVDCIVLHLDNLFYM